MITTEESLKALDRRVSAIECFISVIVILTLVAGLVALAFLP